MFEVIESKIKTRRIIGQAFTFVANQLEIDTWLMIGRVKGFSVS